MADTLPRVVIIGGGFGGLAAAKALAKAPVAVTLIDRRNHHLFQPLLYQVATAALNPSDIAWPIRSILRSQRNCQVLLAEVVSIDTAAREVVLRDGRVPYDGLILATGATHSWFGNDSWAPYAPGLKTIEDALLIRRRMLLAYEAAERETDPARRRAWLTFVVVGAGPTGAEMSGALAEIAREVLRRDFRHIDPALARVVLVEAGDRVLPSYTAPISERARQRLLEMGVEVLLSRRVVGVDEGGVSLAALASSGPGAPPERLPARTVIWGAGVQGSPLARFLGAPLDRAGRLQVAADLSVPGQACTYVVGDLAALAQESGKPVPGVAPAAQQEGRHAAKNLLAELRGAPRAPFRYLDKGSLATLGRAAAVAEVGALRTEGFFAWLMWVFVHIATLVDFRTRLLVMIQWAYAWLRFERGARLITGEVGPLLGDGEPQPLPARPGASVTESVKANPAPPPAR
jgi:NADH dehydrogenase